MQTILSRLKNLIGMKSAEPAPSALTSREMHVVMPDSVDLPLPRVLSEEMSVPASINGRDMSTGRL